MPNLEAVNQLTREEFTRVLGPIFEHSPWIAERAWARRPFASVAELAGGNARNGRGGDGGRTARVDSRPSRFGWPRCAHERIASRAGQRRAGRFVGGGSAPVSGFQRAISRAFRFSFRHLRAAQPEGSDSARLSRGGCEIRAKKRSRPRWKKSTRSRSCACATSSHEHPLHPRPRYRQRPSRRRHEDRAVVARSFRAS